MGLGYTYSDSSIVSLIGGKLGDVVKRCDAFDLPAAWRAMNVAVRNMGRDGLAANAPSALDNRLISVIIHVGHILSNPYLDVVSGFRTAE